MHPRNASSCPTREMADILSGATNESSTSTSHSIDQESKRRKENPHVNLLALLIRTDGEDDADHLVQYRKYIEAIAVDEHGRLNDIPTIQDTAPFPWDIVEAHNYHRLAVIGQGYPISTQFHKRKSPRIRELLMFVGYS